MQQPALENYAAEFLIVQRFSNQREQFPAYVPSLEISPDDIQRYTLEEEVEAKEEKEEVCRLIESIGEERNRRN